MGARVKLFKDGAEWEGWSVDAADMLKQGWTTEEVETSTEGPTEGTVAWIKAELDAKGVDYKDVTLKADLQDLLDMANEPAE